MIRIVLQRDVRTTRELWLLHGLVRVVMHPLPHWQVCPPELQAALAPFRALRTGGDAVPATEVELVRRTRPRAARRARSTTRMARSAGSLPASPPTPPAAPAL
jgi:hypothetical protein